MDDNNNMVSGTHNEIKQDGIVHFVDNAPQSEPINIENLPTAVEDRTFQASLAKFLERPVLVKALTWSQATSVGVFDTFDPWYEFLNNSVIKNKIQNYPWFRATMKLKVVINASPFLYGAAYTSYCPLHTFNRYDSTLDIPADTSLYDLTNYSQRRGVWILPHNNEAGEITLPYFYNRNWSDLTNASEIRSLGQISTYIASPLQSANANASSSININILAWMENVEFLGSTYNIALQSEEYTGIISKPAQVVSSALSKIQSAPVIGKYARVGSDIAKAVGSVAHLFGFSNPPVLSSSIPVRNQPNPSHATSDISFPYEKMCLDKTAELTIDKNVVGLENKDELSIVNFVGRQSYYNKFSWSTSDNEATVKYGCRVNPAFFHMSLYDGSNFDYYRAYHTPLSYVANMFSSWKGDIIITFKVIASKYHKGRLLFQFDPNGSIANNVTNQNNISAVYSQIFDLSETNEWRVRIPWMSDSPYLRCRQVGINATPNDNGTYTLNDGTDNGYFSIRVFNELTAPIDSSSVDVLVFVEGADNFEFAYPSLTKTANDFEVTTLNPQSEEIHLTGDKTDFHSKSSLINYGEKIHSLRQLLRRSTYYCTFPVGAMTSGTYFGLVKVKIPGAITTRGFLPGGTVTNAVATSASSASTSYNSVADTFLARISACFVGQRGSLNYTFNINETSHSTVTNLAFCRTNEDYDTIPNLKTTTDIILQTNTLDITSSVKYYLLTTGGSSIVNPKDMNTQAVVAVDYNVFKFRPTNPYDCLHDFTTKGNYQNKFILTWIERYISSGSNLKLNGVHSYVAAGIDYDLLYFNNVPVLYMYLDRTVTQT